MARPYICRFALSVFGFGADFNWVKVNVGLTKQVFGPRSPTGRKRLHTPLRVLDRASIPTPAGAVVDSEEDAVRALYRRGGTIAGTSAGASALGHTMPMSAEADEHKLSAAWQLLPGLGMLDGAIVDQHFAQRGRRLCQGDHQRTETQAQNDAQPPGSPDPRPQILAQYEGWVRDAEKRSALLFDLAPRRGGQVLREPAFPRRPPPRTITTRYRMDRARAFFTCPCPDLAMTSCAVDRSVITRPCPATIFKSRCRRRFLMLPRYRRLGVFGPVRLEIAGRGRKEDVVYIPPASTPRFNHARSWPPNSEVAWLTTAGPPLRQRSAHPSVHTRKILEKTEGRALSNPS